MQQFAAVVREIRTLFLSIGTIRYLLPYHLHILFGGVGVLFLEKLLLPHGLVFRLRYA